MDFTNEFLEEMQNKKEISKKYSFWYKKLNNEEVIDKKISVTNRWLSKSDRLDSCLNFWQWDAYHKNKLLDLQKVNLCKDRFCPNCKKVALSRALQQSSEPIKLMLDKGYYPFMFTITVPNVHGEDLKKTIESMNKAFSKLWEWIYKPIGDKGFKDRLFDARACIRVLEITTEKKRQNFYHPHFHCIVFLDSSINFEDFEKYIYGGYHFKSQSNIYYSDAEVQLMQLWTLAFKKIRITEISKYIDLDDLYRCHIVPCELPKGIYEVFKYCFKDSHINTYSDFCYILNSIYGKRLKACHGELYNLKIDDNEFDENEIYESLVKYLQIDEKENPQTLNTKHIGELVTTYKYYNKITRQSKLKNIDKIKD